MFCWLWMRVTACWLPMRVAALAKSAPCEDECPRRRFEGPLWGVTQVGVPHLRTSLDCWKTASWCLRELISLRHVLVVIFLYEDHEGLGIALAGVGRHPTMSTKTTSLSCGRGWPACVWDCTGVPRANDARCWWSVEDHCLSDQRRIKGMRLDVLKVAAMVDENQNKLSRVKKKCKPKMKN